MEQPLIYCHAGAPGLPLGVRVSRWGSGSPAGGPGSPAGGSGGLPRSLALENKS